MSTSVITRRYAVVGPTRGRRVSLAAIAIAGAVGLAMLHPSSADRLDLVWMTGTLALLAGLTSVWSP